MVFGTVLPLTIGFATLRDELFAVYQVQDKSLVGHPSDSTSVLRLGIEYLTSIDNLGLVHVSSGDYTKLGMAQLASTLFESGQ